MSQLLDNLQQTIYQHSKSSATASIYLLSSSIDDADDGENEEWCLTLRTVLDGELKVWEGRMGLRDVGICTCEHHGALSR
jgi:hypothetical protein